jgi:hypothetical protein
MKANELRIRNWVYFASCEAQDGYPKDYKKLHQIKEGREIDFCSFFEPIPLTEEWLLKFKFKKDLDGSFVFGLISVFKDKRLKQNVYIYTEDINEGRWVVINDLKLQYVHQLQNLYFALTGEEL